MSIKSNASDAIEKVMHSDGIKIADEMQGKFDNLSHSLEQEMDNALEHAFDRLRDKVDELGKAVGVDLHNRRDKIVRYVKENISRS